MMRVLICGGGIGAIATALALDVSLSRFDRLHGHEAPGAAA